MIDPHAIHMLTGVFGGLFAIFAIVSLVFVVIRQIPYWFIWKKAGFSPWLSLLMLLPLVQLVMLYVLAFSEWPAVALNRPAPPPRV